MGFRVKCMYLGEFTHTKGGLDDRLWAIAAHTNRSSIVFPQSRNLTLFIRPVPERSRS
jgi:hypothetical protein